MCSDSFSISMLSCFTWYHFLHQLYRSDILLVEPRWFQSEMIGTWISSSRLNESGNDTTHRSSSQEDPALHEPQFSPFLHRAKSRRGQHAPHLARLAPLCFAVQLVILFNSPLGVELWPEPAILSRTLEGNWQQIKFQKLLFFMMFKVLHLAPE